jgi:hypothetical protein
MVLSPRFTVYSKKDETGKTIYLVGKARFVEFNEIDREYNDINWRWIDKQLGKAVGWRLARQMRKQGYIKSEARVTPDGKIRLREFY